MLLDSASIVDQDTLKQYESQLLNLNNEIMLLKEQNLSIKVSHQQISKSYEEAQYKLSELSQKLQNAESFIQTLKNQKKQLEKAFRNKEALYSSLYNYVFVESDGCIQNWKQESTIAGYKRNYERKIIQSQFQIINQGHDALFQVKDEQISCLKKCINHNKQALQLLVNENAKLRHQILNITSEYQQKIMRLKEENVKLAYKNTRLPSLQRSKQIIYGETCLKRDLDDNMDIIALQAQYKAEHSQRELSMAQQTIRNLKERINKLLDEKQQSRIIDRNQKQYEEKKIEETILKSSIQDMEAVYKERDQFKKRFLIYRKKMKAITEEFPKLIQNGDEIVELVEEVKKVRMLENQKLEHEKLISSLNKKIKLLQQEIVQITNDKREALVVKLDKYDEILNLAKRLKTIIEIIDPHFKTYGFSTVAELTQRQLELLTGDLEKEIKTFSEKFSKYAHLQSQLTIKTKIIDQKNKTIDNQNEQIRLLKLQKNRLQELMSLRVLKLMDKRAQHEDRKYAQFIDQHLGKLYHHRQEVYQNYCNQLQKNIYKVIEYAKKRDLQLNKTIAERDFYKLKAPKIIFNNDAVPEIPKILQLTFQNVNQINTFGLQKQIKNLEEKLEQIIDDNQHVINNLNKSYEGQIIKLKYQLAKFSEDNKNLRNQLNQKTKILNQTSVEVNKVNQKEKQRQNVSQLIEIENPFIMSDNQLPPNTINQQSMAFLTNLLQNHQNLLKIVLKQYEALKQQYRKSYQAPDAISQTENQLKYEVSQLEQQIKSCRIRLQQADANIEKLNKDRQQNFNQMQTLKTYYEKQVSELNGQIQKLTNLNNKNEQKLQELKLQLSQMNQMINKKTENNQFAQSSQKQSHLQSLLNILDGKNKKIKQLQQEIKTKEHQRRNLLSDHRIELELSENKLNPINIAELSQLRNVLQSQHLSELLKQTVSFVKKMQSTHMIDEQ